MLGGGGKGDFFVNWYGVARWRVLETGGKGILERLSIKGKNRDFFFLFFDPWIIIMISFPGTSFFPFSGIPAKITTFSTSRNLVTIWHLHSLLSQVDELSELLKLETILPLRGFTFLYWYINKRRGDHRRMWGCQLLKFT